MLELSLPPSAAPCLLGALASVSGHPDELRVAPLLSFVASELGSAGDRAGLELDRNASPAALAAFVPAGDARTAVVQRLVLAAMLVPPLDAARLDRLDAYAAALEVSSEPALADLRKALAGQYRRLTARLMRRFPPIKRVRAYWRGATFGQRWRMIKAMIRLRDRKTAARYHKLGELPDGTLGRVFFDHCRSNRFPLPGERRGLPEPMIFHDMAHGLVGAGTDIAGETRMAGFEAGCFGASGFTMLEFALLLFNLGAKLPTDAAPAVGAVDPAILFESFVDGRRCKLDLLAWDPWADIAEPIVGLRARYGLAQGQHSMATKSA